MKIPGEYYGEDEENVRKGVERVRKSLRLNAFEDERSDDMDHDGGHS
jgi:hypothetical protein